jgi:hypothetical protein
VTHFLICCFGVNVSLNSLSPLALLLLLLLLMSLPLLYAPSDDCDDSSSSSSSSSAAAAALPMLWDSARISCTSSSSEDHALGAGRLLTMFWLVEDDVDSDVWCATSDDAVWVCDGKALTDTTCDGWEGAEREKSAADDAADDDAAAAEETSLRGVSVSLVWWLAATATAAAAAALLLLPLEPWMTLASAAPEEEEDVGGVGRVVLELLLLGESKDGRGRPLCVRVDHIDAVISCCCHFINEISACERRSTCWLPTFPRFGCVSSSSVPSSCPLLTKHPSQDRVMTGIDDDAADDDAADDAAADDAAAAPGGRS